MKLFITNACELVKIIIIRRVADALIRDMFADNFQCLKEAELINRADKPDPIGSDRITRML
jgi:hypothetical protein